MLSYFILYVTDLFILFKWSISPNTLYHTVNSFIYKSIFVRSFFHPMHTILDSLYQMNLSTFLWKKQLTLIIIYIAISRLYVRFISLYLNSSILKQRVFLESKGGRNESTLHPGSTSYYWTLDRIPILTLIISFKLLSIQKILACCKKFFLLTLYKFERKSISLQISVNNNMNSSNA